MAHHARQMAKRARRTGKGDGLGLIQPVRVDVGKATQRQRDPNRIPTRAGKQRITILAALWHAGFTYADIARQTGIPPNLVRRDIALAEQHYKLADRLSKVMIRVDAEAVPQAVDNLIATLESEKPEDSARRDEATYRTLSGRGVFRQFASDDGKPAAPTQMALQVNFSAPPGMTMPQQTAQIVGVSRGVPIEHRGRGVRAEEAPAGRESDGAGPDAARSHGPEIHAGHPGGGTVGTGQRPAADGPEGSPYCD